MLCDKVSQQIARTSTTKTVKAKFHCFSFHPFILDLVGFFLKKSKGNLKKNRFFFSLNQTNYLNNFLPNDKIKILLNEDARDFCF